MIPPSKLHPRFWPSIWSDSQLAADTEILARQIVGEDSFADILALAGDAAAPDHIPALARDVAEARIEQRRIWKVQDELLRGLPGGQTFGDLRAAAKFIRTKSPARSMVLAICRYQRRVHTRWKKADRAFDAAVRRQQRRVFNLTKWLQRGVDERTKPAGAA